MRSLREERLAGASGRDLPQLAKAREIAETAEAENRAMTVEEQRTYDEILKKGREVADAMKASIATIRRCSRSRANSPTTSAVA